jgi:two-component system response regulator DesR
MIRKRDKMYRILLADSNPTPRSALALLLETRLDAQIVGQVSSMESLLCEAAATHPDLIILDWELPGEPARERIAALRQKAPHACILASSVRPESASLIEGADAFVCKTDLPETILQTIRTLNLRNAQKGISHA